MLRLLRHLLSLAALTTLVASCSGASASATSWTRLAATRVSAVACYGADATCVATAGGKSYVLTGSQLRPHDTAGPPPDPACRRADQCTVVVSCPSLSFCAAVDGLGDAFSYRDGMWRAAGPVDRKSCDAGCTPYLSCASPARCQGLDNNGFSFSYELGRWSQARPLPGNPSFAALGCPPSGPCVALDVNYDVYLEAGRTWRMMTTLTATTPPGGSEPPFPESVSCADASSCVAVDNFGSYFVRTGSSWTGGSTFDASLENGNATVTCASPHLCAISDDAGNAYFLANGTLTRARDGTDHMVGAACLSGGRCLAFDARGIAFLAQMNN